MTVIALLQRRQSFCVRSATVCITSGGTCTCNTSDHRRLLKNLHDYTTTRLHDLQAFRYCRFSFVLGQEHTRRTVGARRTRGPVGGGTQGGTPRDLQGDPPGGTPVGHPGGTRHGTPQGTPQDPRDTLGDTPGDTPGDPVGDPRGIPQGESQYVCVCVCVCVCVSKTAPDEHRSSATARSQQRTSTITKPVTHERCARIKGFVVLWFRVGWLNCFPVFVVGAFVVLWFGGDCG